MRQVMQQKPLAHFLHIGKTGGTAIKFALDKCDKSSAGYAITLHPHQTRLMDVPKGEKVVFFLRDPASRFTSGFYSRQRQGRPRYFFPWTPQEKVAFGNFETPEQLATALSSLNAAQREAAEMAMKNIQHVRNSYWNWFGDVEYFLSRSADILFVGFQESLDEDFDTLKSILALPENLTLPDDEILAHRNPKGISRSLSETAVANLRLWYSEDYRLVDLCRRMFHGKQPAAGNRPGPEVP